MFMIKVTEFRLKLCVQNFETVRDFYLNVLLFPVITQWDHGDDDKGAMFDTGSGIIEIMSPHEKYVPVQGCDVSLQVEDVNQLWESLQNKATVIFPLRKNNWGDTSFCISDPEGFHLTFFTKD